MKRKSRAYLGFLYNENAHIVDMTELKGYRGDCRAALEFLARRASHPSFACINHFEGGRTAMIWYKWQNNKFALSSFREFREFSIEKGLL